MALRTLLVGVCLVLSGAVGATPPEKGNGNPNFLERTIEGEHVGRTLNQLQTAIAAEGFTFMRIQNVDKGLAGHGFERPPYKIVFFGNREQFEQAREIDPRVTPYLPLKITVYESGQGNTRLSVVDPAVVGRMFNPALKDQFQAWSHSLKRILDQTVKEVQAGTWAAP